jgi:Domain of unknown function (DUF4280)
MPKQVVNSATLQCNHGSTTCSLSTTSAPSVFTSPGLAACMFDFLPGENIDNFGICDVDRKQCVPILPFPWFGEWTDALVSPAPGITEQSKLICAKTGGAEITIEDPGQEMITLGSWSPLDEGKVEWWIKTAWDKTGGRDETEHVTNALEWLLALRDKPSEYYASNLAIASDYFRARQDAHLYSPTVEGLMIRGYMFLKQHLKQHLDVLKDGHGPVSPPSALEEKYMYLGAADGSGRQPLVGPREVGAANTPEGLLNLAKKVASKVEGHAEKDIERVASEAVKETKHVVHDLEPWNWFSNKR